MTADVCPHSADDHQVALDVSTDWNVIKRDLPIQNEEQVLQEYLEIVRVLVEKQLSTM